MKKPIEREDWQIERDYLDWLTEERSVRFKVMLQVCFSARPSREIVVSLNDKLAGHGGRDGVESESA